MTKKNLRTVIIGAIVSIVLCVVFFVLYGMGVFDVVLKYGINSFGAAANEKARNIGNNSMKTWDVYEGESNGFGIDYISNDGLDSVSGIKIWMRIDAAPFIDAGLNISRIQSETISYEPMTNTLFVHKLLKDIPREELLSGSMNKKMSEFLSVLLKDNREILMYHKETNRFGISFGDMFMLEWNKKITPGEGNFYWVINTEPLVNAGLNIGSLNIKNNRHILYLNVK